MSWTPDRVAKLKELWEAGHSAGKVAAMLGGLEHYTDGGRSAVIGKVHRMGFAGRATTARLQGRRSKKRKPQPTPAVTTLRLPPFRQLLADSEPYVPPVEELVIPLNERKSIQTLTETCCRWPIGDPQHPDFHFCGKGKVPGLPYCEVHARRAYAPPNPRQRLPADWGNVVPMKRETVVA